jgi:hypothetical protein|tara:strand:- start:184 stop:324 length:141 start_codon:yes stop_codon:yes gene_type:complete
MSVNSSKQTYESFQEWHKWAKQTMPGFKSASKKKPTQKPVWSLLDE